MPTYRDISINLKSQYDALTIPEFTPPLSVFATPPRRLRTTESFFSFSEHKVSHLENHLPGSFSSPRPSRITTVYVPIYPGSQFWIHYACPEAEGRFYYFKLFVRGQCVLSWGIGDEDGYQGRLAFGVYDGGEDFEGKKVLEKRAFFFPTADAGARKSGSFEIKVYRSHARKREAPKYEKFKMSGNEKENGFR
jgi:hypothetical protein